MSGDHKAVAFETLDMVSAPQLTAKISEKPSLWHT